MKQLAKLKKQLAGGQSEPNGLLKTLDFDSEMTSKDQLDTDRVLHQYSTKKGGAEQDDEMADAYGLEPSRKKTFSWVASKRTDVEN